MPNLARTLPEFLFPLLSTATNAFVALVIYYILKYIFELPFRCSCTYSYDIMYFIAPPCIIFSLVFIIDEQQRRLFCGYKLNSFGEHIFCFLMILVFWTAALFLDGDWYECFKAKQEMKSVTNETLLGEKMKLNPHHGNDSLAIGLALTVIGFGVWAVWSCRLRNCCPPYYQALYHNYLSAETEAHLTEELKKLAQERAQIISREHLSIIREQERQQKKTEVKRNSFSSSSLCCCCNSEKSEKNSKANNSKKGSDSEKTLEDIRKQESQQKKTEVKRNSFSSSSLCCCCNSEKSEKNSKANNSKKGSDSEKTLEDIRKQESQQKEQEVKGNSLCRCCGSRNSKESAPWCTISDMDFHQSDITESHDVSLFNRHQQKDIEADVERQIQELVKETAAVITETRVNELRRALQIGNQPQAQPAPEAFFNNDGATSVQSSGLTNQRGQEGKASPTDQVMKGEQPGQSFCLMGDIDQSHKDSTV